MFVECGERTEGYNNVVTIWLISVSKNVIIGSAKTSNSWLQLGCATMKAGKVKTYTCQTQWRIQG